jgi:hypothetical protein
VKVCATGPTTRCTETNGRGKYTLIELAPGSYSVEFTSPPGSVYEQHRTDSGVPVRAGRKTTQVNASFAVAGGIKGRVTSALTHSPVEGVEVCAEGSFEAGGGWEGGGPRCVATNAAGEYTVSQLPTSQYTVEYKYAFEGARPSRYVTPEWYKQHNFSATQADRVEVTAGKTAAGIDEELEGAAQISGRIISATTKMPLAGIEVCAVTWEYTCTVTPTTGEYVISHIVPNSQGPEEYRVLFRKYEGEYLTRYYNGAKSYQEAEVLTIPPGEARSGIDAEMISACTEVKGEGTEAKAGEPTYIHLTNKLTTNLNQPDSLQASFTEGQVQLSQLSSAKCRALDSYEPETPWREFVGEGPASLDGRSGYVMHFTLVKLYGRTSFDFTLYKDNEFAGGKESTLEQTTEEFS